MCSYVSVLWTREMQKCSTREIGVKALADGLRTWNPDTFIYLINMEYVLT